MLEIIKVIYYIAGTIAIFLVLMRFFESRKPKTPCDSCRNLVMKRKGGVTSCHYRYHCQPPDEYGSFQFDDPPEYCVKYKPRDDDKRPTPPTSGSNVVCP